MLFGLRLVVKRQASQQLLVGWLADCSICSATDNTMINNDEKIFYGLYSVHGRSFTCVCSVFLNVELVLFSLTAGMSSVSNFFKFGKY